MEGELQTFKLYRIELTYPQEWDLRIQAARDDYGDIELVRASKLPGDVFGAVVSLSWRPEKLLYKYSSMDEYKGEVHKKLAKQYKDLQLLGESVMQVNGHAALVSQVAFSAGGKRLTRAQSFKVGRMQAFIRCSDSVRFFVFSAISRDQEFGETLEASKSMLSSIKCH